MERAPIEALSMSPCGSDYAVVISPVSGLTISVVAWFCSALADVRRRSSGLVCHRPTHVERALSGVRQTT